MQYIFLYAIHYLNIVTYNLISLLMLFFTLIHFHRLISDDLLVNLLLKWEVELTSITGEPKQALDSIDFITETVALVIN